MKDLYARKLKAALFLKGMTQKDLSKAANITEATVCRYIKAQRLPTVEKAWRIAKAVDMPIAYFFEE